MTSKELYLKIFIEATASYASKTQDPTGARQMAHALAQDCVNDCARLGLLEGSAAPAIQQPAMPQFGAALSQPQGFPQDAPATNSFPLATAAPQVQGAGGIPQAQVAMGAGTVAQESQPYEVNGQQVVPPAGNTFVPPAQAGVMNNVVQTSTPQGHSALGTGGVISQPIQRPNGQDQIVAPGNQSMIPQVGGSSTTFVPERIVR